MTFEKQPGLWPRWEVKKDGRLCGRVHHSAQLGYVFHPQYNSPPMLPGDLDQIAEFLRKQLRE